MVSGIEEGNAFKYISAAAARQDNTSSVSGLPASEKHKQEAEAVQSIANNPDLGKIIDITAGLVGLVSTLHVLSETSQNIYQISHNLISYI